MNIDTLAQLSFQSFNDAPSITGLMTALLGFFDTLATVARAVEKDRCSITTLLPLVYQ